MIAAHSPSASTSCRTVGTVEGMEELGGDPPWRSVVVPGSITRWQTPRFLPQVVSNASVWDTAKLLPPNAVPQAWRTKSAATPQVGVGVCVMDASFLNLDEEKRQGTRSLGHTCSQGSAFRA